MSYLWDQLRTAVPLITSGNGYVWTVTWLTIRVALLSTAAALVIGLPIGIAIGLSRSRTARVLQILANASMAVPPIVVGLFVLLLILPQGVLGSARIEFTLPAVYLAQTVLALPYIVALTPAAIQGVGPGLLSQARALGARPHQVAVLALREARVSVLAAVIAALGAGLAEVGAVVVVGGNIQNRTQTLATAVLAQVTDYGNYDFALAMTIVLVLLVVLLLGALTLIQQGGARRVLLHPGALPASQLRELYVNLLWAEFKDALPLIFHGNPYLFSVVGFTLEVAAVAVGIASLIGLPVALLLGLGRFRGVRALRLLANASLGLPPVAVGLILFLLFVPQAPLGGLHLNATRDSVFIAQTILALPYVVALAAAALQSLEPGLLKQARLLGARPWQIWVLALREARSGVMAAIIAALGTALAEVGAIVVVGANIYGYDQTLASATLFEANAAVYTDAVALSLVLMVLIVLVMGAASLLQHQHRRGRPRRRPVLRTQVAS